MLGEKAVAMCKPLKGVTSTDNYFAKQASLNNLHSRDVEMLRLIGQYLCDRGLSGAYTQLSKESGVSLEHADATELRNAILEGRWSDAEEALERLVPLMGNPENVEEVRFLILEQRFLEHLEDNEVMAAVTLLRNRITPMQRNTQRLHTLASCLMCQTREELQAQAGGWAGKETGSRRQLINRIQTFVPAQTMLPPRRLEQLIDEAVHTQLSSCIFHNPFPGEVVDVHSVSLLQRHTCGMQDFPVHCVQTLDQRDAELWVCAFSPDGQWLASGGKDANVDVWLVNRRFHQVSLHRTLNTPAFVACLVWSPDSRKLAACCGEDQSSVCVFDAMSGEQLCQQRVHDDDTYTAAAFFADSRKLAFGGLKGNFYVMDTQEQGRILRTVEGCRVQSMAAILAPDGDPTVDQLLVADHLYRVRLFRFGRMTDTGRRVAQQPEPSLATEVAPVMPAGRIRPPSAQYAVMPPNTGASSLTIVFGAPLEHANPAGQEVRTLSALAAPHSRSFAGLVHSLSSMVAPSSSVVSSSSSEGGALGRQLAAAAAIAAAAASTTTTASTTSTTTTAATAEVATPGAGESDYGLLEHRMLFQETHAVQSIAVSRNGKQALVTVHKMGLHLWDLSACAIVQRFVGYKQDKFRLHSTFGGANDNFVATGSEDGRLHLWNVHTGSHPIHSLAAASNGRFAVTGVHWNPALPTMLASVNDAGDLCIWAPERYAVRQPMDST